ncbi:MAG: Coenzyme F420:L-glutamate ligase, partial [Actinomycetota bacterium]
MTIDRAAADKLLTTTRSVRKRLDLDRPVEPEVIAECIDIAMQAPTGTNAQNWAFVVITDSAKRTAIADVYRKGGE